MFNTNIFTIRLRFVHEILSRLLIKAIFVLPYFSNNRVFESPIFKCVCNYLPDPYVRIEISQPSRPVAKKQTTTLKKTSNPVFEESFTFQISVKPEDIHETTISITVYDRERIRTDEAIGHVVLGYLATEACQYGHWQEMIENPGLMSSKWHYLVDYEE